MMPIVMHTMATPTRTPTEALDLAARLELAGIELISQEGYRCGIAPDASLAEARELAAAARVRGLRIIGLVPYAKSFNAPDADARGAAITEMRRAVVLAHALECPHVRVLAGNEMLPSAWETHLSHLVESLHDLAEYAATHGVTLNIENHMETMALSAAQTVRIVREVSQPNVGIVYDQANLTELGSEGYAEALPLQLSAIRHVHVKDFRMDGGARVATVVGEGSIPWPEIIAALLRNGYGGSLSLEYEMRWHPDQLPEPEVGLRVCREYLRHIMTANGKDAATSHERTRLSTDGK